METKIRSEREKETFGEGKDMMEPNEYEKGIAVFDLYGEAIEKFIQNAPPEQVQKVLEVFTKYSGLVGEFGEFCEKLSQNTSLEELLKEISDVEWYLTRLESCFGYSKQEILGYIKADRTIESMGELINQFNVFSGKFGEKIKKMIRDKEGKFTERMDGMQDIFAMLELILMKIETKLGRTKREVIEINYLKLKDRWERKKLGGEGDNR